MIKYKENKMKERKRPDWYDVGLLKGEKNNQEKGSEKDRLMW
jgi:hypothetical protein